jgi:Uma2 family endonuclease
LPASEANTERAPSTRWRGGSLAQGTLVHALHIALGNATEGTPFGSEIKLRVEAGDAYYYPDAMMVCGELEVESETNGIVKNPVVVFEVLSPGTWRDDRGQKFLDYQAVSSLQEIVFVDSDRKVAERYERQEGESWRYTAYVGDVTLPIAAANLEIDLAQLYARLRFDGLG